MAAENTVHGIDDLKSKLLAITPALRKKVLRNALAAGARVVRDEAKRQAPVLTRHAPYRAPGTVKKAIRVRTSKVARRSGDVGVFVNVKPAKSGTRGAKSRTDPFYWRFLEFGTRKMSARPFLKSAADKFPQALAIFQSAALKWFDKVNSTGKVTP